MPGETTSEMTEQQVSIVDEDLLKQSKPDLPDNKLPDDVPNESISIPSINELPNGLKRPLPDGVDSDKKKKKRLTDTSDDEFEDTNNDDSGKNHIEILIQKVSESLENTIDDIKSNVSNKTHNINNETNSSFSMINHNGKNSVDDQNCKDDYLDKNTLSKDISKKNENETSNLNKVNNSSKCIENSVETVKNGINKLTENNILTAKSISCLNKSLSSSSSSNLDIENSDLKIKKVVNDIPVNENISLAGNHSTVTESNLNHSSTKISKIENIENIANNNKNTAENLKAFENKTQNLTKNTDETKIIESRPCSSNTSNDCSDDIGKDFEVIDSDSNSDVSLSDLSDLPEDISNIVSGVHQMTKESFPQLLKLFSKKELTFDQFDSLCTQKIIEIMTERSYMGKERSELQLLKEREKHWRLKYCSLNRQLKEIKTIVNVHRQDLKNNEHARPHLITRTVGLQAVLCPKKESNMKLPKLATPLPKTDNKPVSIVVDDDEDDIELDVIKSGNPSTSNITNTPTKKQISPLVTASKSPVLSPKTITAAKSSNPIKIGTATIDLTENDDLIEKTKLINLKGTISPVKVLHRRGAATIITTQNASSSKTLTQVELPNNPSSSSSSMTRIASSTPHQTSISNKGTMNTSPKSKNIKPFLIDVSRVEPVIVQPCAVAYTAQHVPVSRISGTLQPISTTPRQITVSQLSASLKTLTPVYSTCQLPVARVSGSLPGISLPQASLGTAITACRLPISIRTISHPTSIERSSTGSQLNRPPPPAILLHPSPVPGIPNQKSLPSWKKLPPAPKLTISKTIAVNNMPQALVLSWTMNINKTTADIVSYQVFAYQETPDQPPNIDLWRKIGDVNALPLPMACSLTHFTNGEKYHFLVRAVDVYTRVGPFSAPKSIS
ncbi:PREDICTED: activating transcription factor 7-interacting protein 1-like isoform X2 [Diuraphis noxia]|uniref:activating transcription factor 7-interacting protein 1-like isoform X2 n=1 Tax=Diuraphis noxia TaxID=143948 RepID=UPI0007636964|nr:PREDICTED: activating transcription factor 7-interacting protein 1-like isoform X2 [Diuraphis noxia]